MINKGRTNNLVLNVSPIDFEDAEIEVGGLPYVDKTSLHELRQQHSATHLFRRDGGTTLLAVPIVGNAPAVGDTLKKIRLKDNLGLTAALIRNALINHLTFLPQKVYSFQPLEFLADPHKNNFLARCSSIGSADLSWLSICPLYHADVRPLYVERGKGIVGLVLNVRTRKIIDRTCRDLIERGFHLKGFYVVRRHQPSDLRLSEELVLAGKVDAVRNGLLELSDYRPDSESSVSSGEAYLEPNWVAFNACLDHELGSNAALVKAELEKLLIDFRSGPRRLEHIRQVVSYFARPSFGLEVVPGVPFQCQPLSEQGRSATFPQIHHVPPVTYVFDPAATKTDTWHDRGLQKFGPYSARVHTPTNPRICVICQAQFKGRVEQFVQKFLNGISTSGQSKNYFSMGFVRKYALDGATVEYFTTVSDSASDYRKAAQAAIETQREQNKKWNLTLIQIEDHFREMIGDNNPYLVSKVEFLTHQIPVQEFRIETVEFSNNQLSYVLNNMALATYAKIGGTPWLIRANPTTAHEIVVGLGSAMFGSGRLGESKRKVGITTVFSGDGNYYWTSVSQAVPFENFKDELTSSLSKTLEKIARQMNWMAGEHIRLIFHAFKPFKDEEADAVKQVVNELGEYDAEYAFVHVVEDHPFLIFDTNQPGVKDYESRNNVLKGIYAPDRGDFLKLSDYEALLTLTGPRDLKRSADGIPRPILLKIGRGSTFHDLTYLTRQAHTFASHSWRSFFKSPIPVTVLYSELIAGLLGQLEQVKGWNASVMLGRIGATRWFL